MAYPGTLVVRNEAQKILWDYELTGQLSDGNWENALPYDHWEAWCKADVRVAEKGAPIGRDFYVRRQSYGFTRRDLLDVVGDRMLGYVRLGKAFGFTLSRETMDLLMHLAARGRRDLSKEYGMGIPAWMAQRQMEEDKIASRFDLDKVRAVLADESLYSFKDLIRDLSDLQRIIKVQR